MSTFLQQLINGISLGAIYSLIALGYTMVYGVLKLINFAHGDVYMVGAFMGFYLANGLGVRGAQALGLGADSVVARGLLGGGVVQPSLITALVVMLLAMAICAAIGVLIERLAYRPVRKYSRLTALITAIGVDAHQLRRLQIKRNRAHRSSGLGAIDDQLQPDHQHERDHQHDDVGAVDAGAFEKIDVAFGEEFGEELRFRAEDDLAAVFE